jgi:hypothetical protein
MGARERDGGRQREIETEKEYSDTREGEEKDPEKVVDQQYKNER